MTAAFDAYADNYDDVLNQGLAVSGEQKDFFAHGRVDWLKARLVNYGIKVSGIFDFGCGTGTAFEHLHKSWPEANYLGYDPSPASITEASESFPQASWTFSLDQLQHSPEITDLAFCNGVFHHIPPVERAKCVQTVYHQLKAGGVFAFFENNPWNPGTRYIMSRIPFDRDAQMLWPASARKLLRSNGFQIIKTDFLFVFPRILKPLRVVEPYLVRWPVGAQYLILARKPLK